ncbi:MAG: phosphatidylglycerophosphatase A [Breznakibacter sp.]|nr:phosphatidylglycerophosphatase A [Breznakibacter sp.]
MKQLRLINRLIATAFGLGYSPIAPGTMGAIGGIAVYLLIINSLSQVNMILGLLIILFLCLGIIASNKLESEWGKDPSKIVIDEVVGVWIALLFIPSEWQYTLGAFLLFRFFDIVKPLYIKRAEKLKGGWGVMFDDVLAGVYANIVIQIVVFGIKTIR